MYRVVRRGILLNLLNAGSIVRDRVLAAPRILTWLQRALGTLLLGFATRLAVADR